MIPLIVRDSNFYMVQELHFLLNETEISTTAPSGIVALDYLRKNLRLTGTKEGCREGDCGACTVLVGELINNKVSYKSVNSCLMPLGELHGKHLVTIEGLNMSVLSPIQKAIVDKGATQCGFCTPGIVVSLTGYTIKGNRLTKEGFKKTLGGHLCRCTGYRSLKQGFDAIKEHISSESGVKSHVEKGIIPEYFLNIPARLARISEKSSGKVETPAEFVIAGGTDLYVQKGDILPYSRIDLLNTHPEMKNIVRKNNLLHVGALITFEEFSNHPEVIKAVPAIREYISLIASTQIRNRATLGGNIINASPIADVAILLLAMESTLILKNDNSMRSLPITSFYKGYKQLDKTPSEILAEIIFPIPDSATRINWEKVSKRKYLDVASVNCALKIKGEGGIIKKIHIAMGGVAPIPLFLKNTCDYFLGKQITRNAIEGAFPILQNEISPIDDIRGSSQYKRLLARQLIIAHFTRLFPEAVKVKDFYGPN
ncbi:MAG: (2Fe-2S)-binding protein [Candidatus Kuenenia sp.]|nr:(2Fe-2S)-binding protein [Candidatus Kuenenia hertensis]